jgi:hypothetical protein
MKLRTFDCPETGDLCTDGRCTKELCCEHVRLQVMATKEAAAKEERLFSAKIWDIIGPILKR